MIPIELGGDPTSDCSMPKRQGSSFFAQLCPALLRISPWCGDAKLDLTTSEAPVLAHTVPGLGWEGQLLKLR